MIDGGKKITLPPFQLALVAAPWHLCNRPAIQLGSLKAYLQQEAPWIKIRNHHPYLDVAREIGTADYQRIAADMWLSEALYAGALFPELEQKALRLARRQRKKAGLTNRFEPSSVSVACQRALTAWIDSIDWSGYELIGFSVCFHQLLASLFCARRIKQLYPSAVIVFGGSSVLPDMEQCLSHQAGVDFCISGEGELPLLRLIEELSATKERRTPKKNAAKSAGQLRQLDKLALPPPDYDDFFADMRRSFPSAPFIPVLPIEFSRGCWWNKCSFCNLNLQWQGYRQKSAKQMLYEVTFLRHRHQCLDFTFTDNSLPRAASRIFFEKMRQEKGETHFFAELRVEHTTDFALFRKGGLTEAQVGIEALSASLLARMRKGVSVMDNVFAMKKAAELEIILQGNLITEFPGSTEQERDETLRVLDFVFPYTPLAAATFFLGHDSPVCNFPSRFGIASFGVHPKYRALLPQDVLREMPLLVKGYRGDRSRQRRLWQPVVRKIERWRRYHEKRNCSAKTIPLLTFRDGGDFLIIRQETESGRVLHHRLAGASRAIYLACAHPVRLDEINRCFPELTLEAIHRFLNELCSKRLVFAAEDRYLGLAVSQSAAQR